MWIDDRNYPGGPIGFLFGAFSDPINTLGSVTYVINNCLTDFMVVSLIPVPLIFRGLSSSVWPGSCIARWSSGVTTTMSLQSPSWLS